ncbi:MAG TPA: efflux transporter outer membrane subunit [Aliidongia sp.]|uniref:efflux transporter outer membrane subunit n=1 Tax=Aliidongia sp. TaxID=1914230 RepID=UPI002DDCD8BE|nr:efflux transporter outer membrane subunit [Aliidongia sp.]HEV2676979.1 efflux transporter outer membrane subunit [Aliidongia sp.]
MSIDVSRGRAALSACLLALAAAGCTVGPDYVPPGTDAPAAWTEASAPGLIGTGPEAAQQLQQWWTSFNDPTLDRLVATAITGNLDLKIAQQRLLEARAQRTSAAAGYYPTLSATGSAERQRYSTALKFPPFGGLANTFEAGFDASWEIDIFGKTRRAVEAADASVDASVESRRDVLVSLLAELGQDYATLRSAQARLAIAQRNIRVDQDALDLTREKYKGGLGNELDVAQAQAQLETLNAAVPQLQTLVAQQSHAIAVLLGQEPGALEAELAVPAPLPPAPPILPATMPSDVVRNRPDIRAAERQIAGSNAQIGVAIAQMFPTFSISPSFDLAAGSLHHLLNDGALQWGAPASISVPLFEGGRLEANVAQAKAVAEEDRLTYRKTVLTAFQEVEDALVAYGAERRRHDRLTAAVAADRIAVDRATALYRSGLGNFLSVLDSERSLYSAEDASAQSELTLTQQTIALYKALGAGWQVGEPDGSVKLAAVAK